jgi:hypothetical protein
MRRRLLLLLAAGACLGATGLVLVGAARPQPGVSWRNVARIRAGMSQREVEAILGSPPQASTRGPMPVSEASPADFHTALLWSAAELDIIVYLDRQDRVISREGVGSPPHSLRGRVRAWLGR